MKAPRFQYLRPDSVEEAVAMLAAHGDAAQILAGGQSLMPMLNMRVASPDVVIDINRLQALAGIAFVDGWCTVGALTRYADIMADGRIAQHLPLLAMALPYVAHSAIRNRGTIGGSLALADPAAEMPACALALGAEIELASQAGRRRVLAQDFFLGLYETARQAEEMLIAIHYPIVGPVQCGFYETARRHGDIALAGAAVVRRPAPAGGLPEYRIAAFGLLDRPILATRTAEICANVQTAERMNDVLSAFEADICAAGDIQGDARTRLIWARTALQRALEQLAPSPL